MQSKIALIAMTLVVQAACSKVKTPVVQPRGTVVAPAYPVDPTQAFQLTEAKTSFEFNSNVLLWDQPTGPQVERILDVTRQTRVIRADAIDVIKSELIPAKKRVDELQALAVSSEQKVSEAQRNRDLNALRGYMRGVTASYVDNTLKELVEAKAISVADQTHAALLWQGYCEGKLWEFAVSPLLARSYSERPTPNALCEAYYQSKNYFADADRCGAATTAAGKDYFGCIWNDGVLKSPLFPAKEATAVPACSGGTASRAQAIAGWIARDGSGPLRNLLRDEGIEAVSKRSYANLFAAAVMDGLSLSRTLFTHSPFLAKCRNAFNRYPGAIPADRDVDAAGVPYWRQDTPAQLVLIGEIGPEYLTAGSTPRYRLLPLGPDDAVNTSNFAKLGGAVIPFAKRDGLQPSYSDSQLNVVVGSPELRTSQAYRDAVDSGPLFSGLSAFDPPALKELKSRLAVVLADLAKAQADFAAKKEAFNKVTIEGIQKNITEAAAVGEVDGASVFLNTYLMKVVRDGDFLKVTVTFDYLTDQTQVGCLNLATNTPCELSTEELGAKGHVASVGFDRSASLITLTFGLGDHPEDLGFPVHPRNVAGGDIPFNSLEPKSLVGKSFQVEVYGNQLRDLPIVTGNAYLLDTDGKTRLYSGSLTGDAFYQVRSQLSTANHLGL